MKSALVRGWLAFSSHSRLWLIVWLILVFPALFLYSFGSIAQSSIDNAKSVEISRISSFQSAIELILSHGEVNQAELQHFLSEEKEVTGLQLARVSGDELLIIFDTRPELIGTKTPLLPQYRTALTNPGTSFVIEDERGVQHLRQAYRSIQYENEEVYLLTEHNFLDLRNLISSRVSYSYTTLSLVFLFIIFLAYWLAKQINYEKRYQLSLKKLADRDLFTNSLAHELRAPLTAMRGYASLIEESEAVPAESKAFASKISQSTARLVTLVNDFLEAARIQSGKLALSKTETNINQLILLVGDNAKLTAQAKALAISFALPEPDILLLTDSKRLEQILTNILSNSIKYTEKGTVTLSAKQDYSKVTITIADTGNGISAADQKKLFNPFVRVGDSAQIESVTGTGLGMWITKQLVEQLGGTIELESIKGVGTHVFITFSRK